MPIEGKKINELSTTATITSETVVPVVVVNEGVASVEAQKVTVQNLSEHFKGDIIPDQSGQSGKFLSTDGASVTWETVQDPSVFYVEDTTNITATINPEWNHEPGTTIIVGKAQIGATDVTASGSNALATGSLTNATGIAAHAEGIRTTAGSQLAAWNNLTEYQIGDRCLYGNVVYEAKTNNTNSTPSATSADWKSLGNNAAQHSEGNYTTASGTASHSEGAETTANGIGAHAEGFQTIAAGDYAHAEGNNTVANAGASHAEGMGTVANQSAQHVQGKYNVIDTTNAYAYIIGGGGSDANRDNIQTTTWAGNFWTKGTITDGSGNVLSNKIDKTTQATVSTLGLVRPDGATIHIDQYGTISGASGSGVEVLHYNGVNFDETYAKVKEIVTTDAPVMVIQASGPRLMKVSYTSNVVVFTGVTDEQEYTLTVTLNDETEVAACTLTIITLQKIFQYTTMPSGNGNNGKVAQYIGNTNSSYTKGYFYACVNNAWTQINTQPETQTAFSQITGQPTDNTNLSNTLDKKQNILTAGNHINISAETVSGVTTTTITATGYQEPVSGGLGINIDASNNINATILDTSYSQDTDVVINTLASNTTYQLGVVDSITISDYTRSYEETTIYFTTGVNGTTVTLPVDNSIFWAMSEPPTFEANKKCIICIVNGYALTGGN